MPGRMGELVQAGAVVVDLVEERGLRRHLHVVGTGRVVGHVAADPDLYAARRDHFFGDGNDLALGQWRGRGRKVVRQTLALRGIEDGEALEERHAARVFSCLLRALTFGCGNEAIGIDDCGAAFALADRTARLARLPESQPALRGIAALDDRLPQDEDVDSRIGAPGERVARQARPGRAGGVSPRLNPRQASRFQFADDAVGNFVVEIATRALCSPVERGGRCGRTAPAASAAVGVRVHDGLLPAPKPDRASPEAGGGR